MIGKFKNIFFIKKIFGTIIHNQLHSLRLKGDIIKIMLNSKTFNQLVYFLVFCNDNIK